MADGNLNKMYSAVLILPVTAGLGADEIIEFSNQGHDSVGLRVTVDYPDPEFLGDTI